MEKVTLACSDLSNSIKYWNGLLGLKIYSEDGTSAVLGYADDQAKLELRDISEYQAFFIPLQLI